MFNILRGHIEGSNVLDLFAGVGTMGLEAVSRGAAQVLMVEQDRRIFSLLKQNVEMLGCHDKADLLCGDALGSVPVLRSPRPLRVVFMDPPFKMLEQEGTRTLVLGQLKRLAPLLSEDAIIVMRSPLSPGEVDFSIEGLAGPEVRAYRKQHEVLLYGLASADSDRPGEDEAVSTDGDTTETGQDDEP